MGKLIIDSELHAYLDNQLSAEQVLEFELRLENDPAAKKKLAEYQSIEQSLKQLYQPVFSEPAPEHLIDICKKSSLPTKPLLNYWIPIAASLVFFMLGSLSGWQLSQLSSPAIDKSMTSKLAQPAVFAHSIYSVEKIHPVEVGAEKSQHMNQWLSKRLKTKLKAPDLSKYKFDLVGGRLLPSTQQRMAAQFMYQNTQGTRITLYIKRGNWDKTETAVKHMNKHLAGNNYNVSYWIDESLGYVLTSPLDFNLNQKMSESIYQQMSLNNKLFFALL
ncbi:MAG: anti-sigma factor [Pseudomonadota bacterium]